VLVAHTVCVNSKYINEIYRKLSLLLPVDAPTLYVTISTTATLQFFSQFFPHGLAWSR